MGLRLLVDMGLVQGAWEASDPPGGWTVDLVGDSYV